MRKEGIAKWIVIIIGIAALLRLLFGCSVTVGTVLINDDGKTVQRTDITETKPVTVQTDATIPVSALP